MNLSEAKDKEQTTLLVDYRGELSTLLIDKKDIQLDHIYVYVACSVKKYDKVKRFKLDEVDKAIEFWQKRSQVKCKRIYIALGVDYKKGATDLLVAGTMYI
jgi:hypothetical protein